MTLLSRVNVLKGVDATLGALLCRLTAWFGPVYDTGATSVPPPPDSIRRILVIRPGGMGDMLLLLPALQALRSRFPGVHLTVVCEQRNLGVLRLAGIEHTALPYDVAPLHLLRTLTRAPFDVAIDTEQFHHFSALFARLSRAPVRIGFKINPLRNPLYTHLVNYALEGHESSQFARLLAPLGITTTPNLNGLLAAPPPPLAAPLEPDLAAFAPAGVFAVVHPGSSNEYKLWPDSRFVEVVGRLRRDHALPVVLLGDTRDAERGQHLVSACQEAGVPVLSLQGRLGLEEAAAVIRRARCFIGIDSGMAHLACAAGRPTVVLFGPSDAQKWGVDGRAHATVKAELACAPCFIFGYHKPCHSVACMQQITVEAAMAACARVLQESQTPKQP